MTAPPVVSRLLSGGGPALSDYRAHFGDLPCSGRGFVDVLDHAGLTGRGGAGFPAARKMAAVNGRKPVVIGNGAEGEPLSRKDLTLLTRAPHLVLDGLQAAAGAIGAQTVVLYLRGDALPAAAAAVRERQVAGLDGRPVELVEAPDRFVAGEESAAIRRIAGGPALPRDRTVPAAVSGLRGRPTLVHNVETLAHIALIARFGPEWFRAVGDPESPGTMLVTLSGAVDGGVVEVPTGTPIAALLDLSDVQAVLVGGYHGRWIPAAEAADVRVGGAGIVHALGSSECGLARTAEIAHYLADQSARQCGPCLNGLPTLAALFERLAHGRPDGRLLTEIGRIIGLVDGRGSCRHPDGTVRMLRSALTVFADDIDRHRDGGCLSVSLR